MDATLAPPGGANPLLLAAEMLDPPGGGAEKYYDDPVGFVQNCIRWDSADEERGTEPGGPTPSQQSYMRLLVQKHRVAVRGGHGLGKSACNAWLVLWFALTRDARGTDWKVITTASTWRQLEDTLWPEIRVKWAPRLKWGVIGRQPFSPTTELQKLRLVLQHGHAYAAACEHPAKIEGAHADSLLYIFDEAREIPAATFQAAMGAFSGAGEDTKQEAFALVTSTPGESAGTFYDIHMRRPGYERYATVHVTKEDQIRDGRMSAEFVEEMAGIYGEDSAAFQRRVLGEFAQDESDGLIRLAWIEAAQERWREWAAEGVEMPTPVAEAMAKGNATHWPAVLTGLVPGAEGLHAARLAADENTRRNLTCIGVDVAETGEDRTVLAMRYGNVIGELRRLPRGELPQTTGYIMQALRDTEGMPPAIVDANGAGQGVPSYLRKEGYSAVTYKSHYGTKVQDQRREHQMDRQRDAACWHMRDLLDPSLGHNIALPPDENLTAELLALRWDFTATGKVKVESKREVTTRLGHSPDAADAVIQAFWYGAGIIVSAPRPIHKPGGNAAQAVLGQRAAPRSILEPDTSERLPQGIRRLRKASARGGWQRATR